MASFNVEWFEKKNSIQKRLENLPLDARVHFHLLATNHLKKKPSSYEPKVSIPHVSKSDNVEFSRPSENFDKAGRKQKQYLYIGNAQAGEVVHLLHDLRLAEGYVYFRTEEKLHLLYRP